MHDIADAYSLLMAKRLWLDIPLARCSPSHGAQNRRLGRFKGSAIYWTLAICQPHKVTGIPDVAWSYPTPSPRFAAIAGHMAFYASRLTPDGIECWADNELVKPQPGDFYGGWITSKLRGPFKGEPGTGH